MFLCQEKENVFISLVRSNDENKIGFLKDYRRMNVAITRAKDQLIVIGVPALVPIRFTIHFWNMLKNLATIGAFGSSIFHNIS